MLLHWIGFSYDGEDVNGGPLGLKPCGIVRRYQSFGGMYWYLPGSPHGGPTRKTNNDIFFDAAMFLQIITIAS